MWYETCHTVETSTGLCPPLLLKTEGMRPAALTLAGYGPLPVLPFAFCFALPCAGMLVLAAFVCKSEVKGRTWHRECPVLDLGSGEFAQSHFTKTRDRSRTHILFAACHMGSISARTRKATAPSSAQALSVNKDNS